MISILLEGREGTDLTRNVMGIFISFHLPDFHRHLRSALMAQESSIENPVDLSTVTSFTEPVFTRGAKTGGRV
jgi:hypothetical protein